MVGFDVVTLDLQNGHIPPYPSPPPYSSGQGSPPPVPARNRLPSPFGGRPLKPLPIPGQTAASDPLQVTH